MNTEINIPFLKEYLAYMASNPGLKPLFKFPSAFKTGNDVPDFFATLHRGDIYVYPEFVIFLTTAQGRVGKDQTLNFFVEQMTYEFSIIFKLKEVIENPLNILKDIGKNMGEKYQNNDTLSLALTNTNSAFIPIESIFDLEAGRKLTPIPQGNFIKLMTKNGVFIICQDGQGETFTKKGMFRVVNLKSMINSSASLFTGNWNTDFLNFIKEQISIKRTMNFIETGKNEHPSSAKEDNPNIIDKDDKQDTLTLIYKLNDLRACLKILFCQSGYAV